MSDTKRQIGDVRDRILRLDLELLEQLERRAALSREVHALLETGAGAPELSEAEWTAALENKLSGELPRASALAIFRQIRAEARALEQPVRVAYFGPTGGFGHSTAQSLFGSSAPTVSCASVADALDEVVRGRAAFAVFPFENSVDGLIQSAITALADTELMLLDERTVAASYDLVTRAEDLRSITAVYVTPTARAACQRLLHHQLGQVTVVDVAGPTVAAEQARADANAAAVVPSPWQDPDLPVLRANVGDHPELRLRFGVVGTRPAMRSGNDATALLFSVKDAPGTLYEVLRHFAERGVNLRKLHSRPVKAERDTWDYVFYVEAAGHLTDRPIVTALEAVKKSTRYVRLLGSFPVRH